MLSSGVLAEASDDRHRAIVARAAPHVAMMASGDERLLSRFALGNEDSLGSRAALMPAEIVALDRAAGDAVRARVATVTHLRHVAAEILDVVSGR